MFSSYCRVSLTGASIALGRSPARRTDLLTTATRWVGGVPVPHDIDVPPRRHVSLFPCQSSGMQIVNPAPGTTFHNDTSTPRTVASHFVAGADALCDAVAAAGAGDGASGLDRPPDEHAVSVKG